MTESSGEKRRGGRPAKFAEPSRPVTMTLPDRVLRWLATVDADRAQAVTRVVDSLMESRGRKNRPVTTVRIGGGQSIILVGYSERLKRHPLLRLVEVAPGRHLISIRSGTAIESVEVALEDILDERPLAKTPEREMLEMLLDLIRSSRRTNATRKEEILIMAGEISRAGGSGDARGGGSKGRRETRVKRLGSAGVE